MTNRGMATFAEIASVIRDNYYAGELEREEAFQMIHSLCCEMMGGDKQVRHLKACLFTFAYMEPDVEC